MDKKSQIFIRKFRGKFGKSIHKYQLINDADHILVGISGGKDSLCLLESLAHRLRYSKEQYKLTAAYIDIKQIPYKVNKEWLKNFCNEIGVPLIIKDVELDLSTAKNKSICFYCSWERRKTLFNLRKELGCNKLALGHHADDALETLLLNMVYHGTISSLPAKLQMFEGEMQLIRPLIEFSDDETTKFAKIMEYPLNNTPCPNEDKTSRTKARKMLNEISNSFPQARKNMMNAMQNIYIEYLPNADEHNPIIPIKGK